MLSLRSVSADHHALQNAETSRLANLISVLSQVTVSKPAAPAKESRDELVARLKDEQAAQTERLEALKQVIAVLCIKIYYVQHQ